MDRCATPPDLKPPLPDHECEIEVAPEDRHYAGRWRYRVPLPRLGGRRALAYRRPRDYRKFAGYVEFLE